MNPITKLDTVFSVFSPTNRRLTVTEVRNELIKKDVHIDVAQLQEILRHLKNDGYIDYEVFSKIGVAGHQGFRYVFTYKGQLFQFQGGYTRLFNADYAESKRVETLENFQKNHQRWMTVLTLLVAVGTSVAAWYYVQQIWLFYNK